MNLSDFFNHLISFESLAVLIGTTLSLVHTFVDLEKIRRKLLIRSMGITGGIILLIAGSFSDFNKEKQLKRIERSTSENSRLSRETTDLQKEINNFQTGGNSYSFCMYYSSVFFTKPIVIKGKYPLINLNVISYVFNNLNGFFTPEIIVGNKLTTRVTFPMANNGSIMEIPLKTTNDDLNCYFLNFTALNGNWFQFIIDVKINGRREFGYHVVRFNSKTEKKELLEANYSASFPNNLREFLTQVDDRFPVSVQLAADPTKLYN